MCDCLEQVNKKLAPDNKEVGTNFVFGKPFAELPMIPLRKIGSGRMKGARSMLPTFCPFCGVKYEDT
jgi:hypothetical protein